MCTHKFTLSPLSRDALTKILSKVVLHAKMQKKTVFSQLSAALINYCSTEDVLNWAPILL